MGAPYRFISIDHKRTTPDENTPDARCKAEVGSVAISTSMVPGKNGRPAVWAEVHLEPDDADAFADAIKESAKRAREAANAGVTA